MKQEPSVPGVSTDQETAPQVKLAQDEISPQAWQDQQNQLQEAKDKQLRLMAELENSRRRWERERTELAVFIKTNILVALLPAWEQLERGAREIVENPALDENVKKGFLMVLKNFEKFLGEQGLQKISSPVGSAADPIAHEVVSAVSSAEHEEGMILAVEQDGYLLAGKVLRPARVIVAGKKD